MDWSLTLKEIRAKKLALARLDPRGGMPVVPPAGATEETIKKIERRLGRRVPPSYRAFLAQHDGFPNLFQTTSLLNARHLARGTYVDVARMVLEECETPSIESTPRNRVRSSATLVPFAIDPSAETVVAWNPAVALDNGELEVVVWMNEIGVRVDSFPRFLELVLEMLDADLEDRSALLAPRSEPRARSPMVRAESVPLARTRPAPRALTRAG